MAQGKNYNYGFSPFKNNPSGTVGYNNKARAFANDYRQNPNNYNATVTKHSGAKSGIDKNGNLYVRGWKYDRREGLRSFFCSSYEGEKSKTKDHVSKTSGRIYQNWVCKVTLNSGETFMTGCLYEAATGKVTVPQLGFVLNPKGGRGGYCGKFSNK